MTKTRKAQPSLRGRSSAAGVTICVAILSSIAQAQSAPPATPAAKLEYAAITATGNTVTMTRIPVNTDRGVVYRDVMIQFDVDPDGGLTLSGGLAMVTTSPSLLTAGFQRGIYHSASTVWGGKGLLAVSGPGVTAGGATVWTSSTTDGADGCTYPRNVVWYVGPSETSPIAARLKKANITSTLWSYGLSGGGRCGGQSYAWEGNNIIGVAQVGNTITMVTFSSDGSGNTDKAEPIDQLTFTLKP